MLLRRARRNSSRLTSGFLEILSELHDRHLEFVIVGGVAAVLHGGSRATFDRGERVARRTCWTSPSCSAFGAVDLQRQGATFPGTHVAVDVRTAWI